MDIVERIKEEVKITEIFAEVTRIDSSGFCKCPFHQETTPSCKLDKHKNMYYCFGCNSGGDVFTFIQALHNVSFAEAKKILAERIGIKLEEEPLSEDKKMIIAICNESCKFFVDRLKISSSAQSYLEKREINQESIEKFKLGYAPEDQYVLYKYLKSSGFEDKMISESGLFLGTRCRFRNRIMFPIIEYSGNCIGFGGRILEKAQSSSHSTSFVEPKYINSAQTIAFSKKRSLYGVFDKKLFNGKNRVYIVEGNFDVIKMEQQGFSVSVAPLGTALSQEQIKSCWKISQKPVILLDGDEAGRKAVLRAMETVAPIITLEQQVAFAYLRDNHDPDSFLSLSRGKEKMQSILDQSMELQEAMWNHVEHILNSDESTIVTKIAIASRFIRRLINMITDQDLKFAYQSYFRQKLSSISRTSDQIVLESTPKSDPKEQRLQDDFSGSEDSAQVPLKLSISKPTEMNKSIDKKEVYSDKNSIVNKGEASNNIVPDKIEIIMLNRLVIYLKLMILSIIKNSELASLDKTKMISELVESSDMLRSWSGFQNLREVVDLISSTESLDMLRFTVDEIKTNHMKLFNDYTILAHPIIRKTGTSLSDSFAVVFSSAKVICDSLANRSRKLNPN